MLAALPEEIAGLVEQMSSRRVARWGQRDFHAGILHGQSCVIALSRIGKVAAAASAATLIHRFDVKAIVFSGVAGGMGPAVRVGDVVLAEALIQHDLDASPLFPRFEVPLLGQSRFKADPGLTGRLAQAVGAFLPRAPVLEDGSPPRLHRGMIASGDRFVSGDTERAALRRALPDLLAVDMEGAAVAQVCYEHDVPFAMVRTISDTADEHAAASFARFLAERAAPYAQAIFSAFLAPPVA
ncbi:5'-methylthioadenosine/adenosylhomocysteine nucleosidase [Robbsia sp. Bb-Pol-6]|uniref:adenosylhomocysteine nucleosidase n=2 Tax=Robbsia betulipollinis TaxID=2981849 RepID=A0ABT3ZMI9_9BURK|nr:5'-methylthioadenosine/adenosylhomocysteine nucleosidase [Robbsia betulipollinis]MCY0387771.1 5'-methylthioadenosine/adenosylhomocysteine nucleosidase [Robbsia betulipollinis]